jgi:peroxiredoxin
MINLNSRTTLDSAIIDKEGNFKLQSSTKDPNLFMVRIESGPFINLCLRGGERIRISADFNDFTNYNISGSEESEQIRALVLKTREILLQINKLSMISEDSINSPNYAAIKMDVSREFDKQRNDLRAFSKEFIKKNSTSLICLLALKNQIGPQFYVLHPLNDKEFFLEVDSVLMSVYPKSELVLSFHNELINFLSQAEATQSPSGLLSAGQLAPEIELPSPDGKKIKLSSLRGKYVLLDFWAAWCPPCRAENPNLVMNYQKYHSKGLEIFQVSLDRTREDWLKGINDDNLKWLHVSDLKYWNSEVVSMYGITGIPMNYLLDKEGKVIAGNLRGPALSEKLMEIFGQ